MRRGYYSGMGFEERESCYQCDGWGDACLQGFWEGEGVCGWEFAIARGQGDLNYIVYLGLSDVLTGMVLCSEQLIYFELKTDDVFVRDPETTMVRGYLVAPDCDWTFPINCYCT